jgi:hypothetical protein
MHGYAMIEVPRAEHRRQQRSESQVCGCERRGALILAVQASRLNDPWGVRGARAAIELRRVK